MAKNRTCKDEGPLTPERSKSGDEEISAKVVDFLDRNDPNRTKKPFFVPYDPARMHVTTVLAQKYRDMVGSKGGKHWGVNEAGMKQSDDNIGVVLKKLEDIGQLANTVAVFTTDNGADAISFPDGGVTPFKRQKGEAPLVVGKGASDLRGVPASAKARNLQSVRDTRHDEVSRSPWRLASGRI
jgi:arylsulfatase